MKHDLNILQRGENVENRLEMNLGTVDLSCSCEGFQNPYIADAKLFIMFNNVLEFVFCRKSPSRANSENHPYLTVGFRNLTNSNSK